MRYLLVKSCGPTDCERKGKKYRLKLAQQSRGPGMLFQLQPASSNTCHSCGISRTHSRVGQQTASLRMGGTEWKTVTLGQGRADGRARGANVFLPSESETRKQICWTKTSMFSTLFKPTEQHGRWPRGCSWNVRVASWQRLPSPELALPAQPT